MIVEVDHYPRCAYAINGGHNAIILVGLGFIYKASDLFQRFAREAFW
ncbi:hypothetical protein AB4090_01750 [Acidithiobacillus sp. IBUN Pt1247-S3]